jgi:hypothetical protein
MPMTNQEIFNRVSKHLLTQRKKAKQRNGLCVYRVGSLKCAIGALIEDKYHDEYLDSSDANSRSLPDPSVLKALLASKVISNYDIRVRDSSRIILLHDLQEVHDYHRPNQWQKQLVIVAELFNLDPSIVGTV